MGLAEGQDVPEIETKAGWPDGRRKFGTVSGAILRVLEQSSGEMSNQAIREQVEALLGGTVSRFSISDFLLVRSKETSLSLSGRVTGTTASCREKPLWR